MMISWEVVDGVELAQTMRIRSWSGAAVGGAHFDRLRQLP